MNYTLPYYGKKGTISNIKENERYYQTERYGLNKKETYILNVPKNKKNEELIIKNYYDDLKEYLNINKEKYNIYKEKRSKTKINSLKTNILKLSSITMIAISIPLLLTHDIRGYIGITLDILSIPIIITSIKNSINERQDKKRKQFINKYNDLEHRLRIYNEKKSKNKTLTQYTSLKTYNKEPIRDLNKKLELKKAS